MTVEEKRQAIREHCKTYFSCSGCKLHFRGSGGCHTDATDSEVDRNYRILFGDKDPTVYPMNHIRENLGMDPVNRPAHYTDGKIEVIEYIEDKKLGFCLGNAIKYISRAGKKDPTKEIEDLKKAKWYIERRIKELEEV